MALSRVRKLEDLTLWDLCPSAVSLLSFYKKLLAWCDYVDSIRPTPPTEVVQFPERCDDTSNAPLPAVDKLVSKDPSTKWQNPQSMMEVICLQKDLPCTISCGETTFNILCCVFRNTQCFANSTDFVGWKDFQFVND